jgi:radical SAM protein (TIGR01212 family)
MNEFPWKHHRRFNAYANYFRQTFGERVQKVAVNAGFTCPNRDGTIGTGGCTFCNNQAFNPSYCKAEKSVSQQIKEGMEFLSQRYKNPGKYLAYFQAYSNTYDEINILKRKYEEALKFPKVAGLVIGTRPDCIDDEKLDYFQQLAEKYYIILEYGIESCYNKTLQRINRGHDFESSVEALRKTAQRGIKTGAHIIFGLSGESRQEMLEEADILSKLPLNNLKFHQLQIFKDTQIEEEYMQHPDHFQLFGLEEYIDFIVKFLERLNPKIVIERFYSEAPPRFLAGPRWGLLRNDQILVMIEKKLEEMNTWQGKKFYSKA